MRKRPARTRRLIALLAFSTSLPLFGAATQVTVSGRKLLVNGQAFTVQGVNYSPTPVGSTVQNPSANCSGPYLWWTDRHTYVADFPLIQKLGANTLRTFSLMNTNTQSAQVLQVLDQAQADNLHVVMGYFVPTFVNLADATVQSQIQSELLTSVNNYKNHPAVLMWVIGNEQNLNNGNNTAWYDFLNQLAGMVKSTDPNHPIASVEGECPQGGCATAAYNIGNAAVHADDAHMTNLDIWGVTAYRGTSFQGLFQALAVSATTTKPILVAEFGKDAYRDSAGQEDQTIQASYINSQWQEIASNLSAAGSGSADLVGGSVFEWTDEWWKDSADDCLTHGNQVLFVRASDAVDPNYQEEWFGLAAVSPVNAVSNPGGTNRILRKSYTTLQTFWNPAAVSATAAGGGSYFSGTVRNYPNPFRIGVEATDFVVLVNETGSFDIRIYDAGSQFVTSFSQDTPSPGRYTVNWDGHNRQGAYVSPALYFAKIHGHSPSHDETQYRRVVGVK